MDALHAALKGQLIMGMAWGPDHTLYLATMPEPDDDDYRTNKPVFLVTYSAPTQKVNTQPTQFVYSFERKRIFVDVALNGTVFMNLIQSVMNEKRNYVVMFTREEENEPYGMYEKFPTSYNPPKTFAVNQKGWVAVCTTHRQVELYNEVGNSVTQLPNDTVTEVHFVDDNTLAMISYFSRGSSIEWYDIPSKTRTKGVSINHLSIMSEGQYTVEGYELSDVIEEGLLYVGPYAFGFSGGDDGIICEWIDLRSGKRVFTHMFPKWFVGVESIQWVPHTTTFSLLLFDEEELFYGLLIQFSQNPPLVTYWEQGTKDIITHQTVNDTGTLLAVGYEDRVEFIPLELHQPLPTSISGTYGFMCGDVQEQHQMIEGEVKEDLPTLHRAQAAFQLLRSKPHDVQTQLVKNLSQKLQQDTYVLEQRFGINAPQRLIQQELSALVTSWTQPLPAYANFSALELLIAMKRLQPSCALDECQRLMTLHEQLQRICAALYRRVETFQQADQAYIQQHTTYDPELKEHVIHFPTEKRAWSPPPPTGSSSAPPPMLNRQPSAIPVSEPYLRTTPHTTFAHPVHGPPVTTPEQRLALEFQKPQPDLSVVARVLEEQGEVGLDEAPLQAAQRWQAMMPEKRQRKTSRPITRRRRRKGRK